MNTERKEEAEDVVEEVKEVEELKEGREFGSSRRRDYYIIYFEWVGEYSEQWKE